MILLVCLLLSFPFDWEDISNTRDSISSANQTPWISSKILRCASYFELPSRCLDIPMKHRLSCLIYCLNCLLAPLTKYFDGLFYDNCINSRAFIGVFSLSISVKTHEFIIYAMRQRARAANSTICCRKKTNGCQFFMRLSCCWRWISS